MLGLTAVFTTSAPWHYVDLMSMREDAAAHRRAVQEAQSVAEAEAADALRIWRTMIDEYAAEYAEAAGPDQRRTRIGLKRLWVVDGIPTKVMQHADDHETYAAVGIARDGSWKPLETLYIKGQGTTYRAGNMPAVSSAIPKEQVRSAFVSRL